MTTFGFFGNTLSHLLHGIRKYPSIPKIATIAIMMVVFIFNPFIIQKSLYHKICKNVLTSFPNNNKSYISSARELHCWSCQKFKPPILLVFLTHEKLAFFTAFAGKYNHKQYYAVEYQSYTVKQYYLKRIKIYTV